MPHPPIHPAIRRLSHPLRPDLLVRLVALDAYADTTDLDGLPAADRARAERMLPSDGRRFLASRHALRHVLSGMLGRDAESLRIETDGYGKPRLAECPLHFNLSRGGPWALIGASPARAVGVDLEPVRPVQEAEGLASSQFSPSERRVWADAAPEERDRTFLRCWTRKEACVKAVGLGISIPLASVEVGCGGEVRALAVAAPGRSAEVVVASVRPSPDLVAAVAATRLGPSAAQSELDGGRIPIAR